MSRLSNSSGRSVLKGLSALQQFKQPPGEAGPIYHDALSLPSFLQQNLNAKGRKVKEFTGDYALLKAFYFSLMRLAFDLEEAKDYAGIVREVLLGDGEFGAGELQDRDLSDSQYRKFLGQFMSILQGDGPFEEAIRPYPIVDTILLRMFRQLVPVTLLLRDDSDQRVAERVLRFLAGKFQVRMESVSGCFKLVEPDMFVYVSSLALVYLVYVQPLGDIPEVEEKSSINCSDSARRSAISQASVASKSQTNKSQPKSEVSMVSKRSGKDEKGKNFQTVINILDSNRSMPSKDSADKRNSLEGEIGAARIDSIKENIEECSDYYGDSPSFSNHSQSRKDSVPSIKRREKALLQPPPNTTPHTSHPPSIPSQPPSARSIPSLHSEPPKPLPASSLSNCYSSPSHSSRSSQFSSGTPLRGEEGKSMVKTYISPRKQQQPFSKFSSQIYTASRPSNLGIFSSMKQEQAEESICDDSGYGKFTKTPVLQVLDEQFRQEIKMIKKKYRAERKNIANHL